MPAESISLARALSKFGFCSRSRAALYIKAGKVAVNGNVIKLPSSRVDPNKDVVEVDKRHLSMPMTTVLMLHKPRGFVTTASDELSRKTVYDLVPSHLHLFPVGRLDLDTTGLLLFTNNGSIQNRINSPESEIPKTYLVGVIGKVTRDQVKKLMRGVEIRDGIICKADECEIVGTDSSNSRLRIKIHEGKNREIIRMFHAIGKKVSSLHRTAIGKLELDIPEGRWRELSRKEIERVLG